jgi:hypothetical protein
MSVMVKKVLGEADVEPAAGAGYPEVDLEKNRELIRRMLLAIHERYVDELMGCRFHADPSPVGGCSSEEAEARWQAAEPRFRRIVTHPSPEQFRRLGYR